MNAMPDYEILRNTTWRTISAAPTGQGYAVYEAADRFWRERMAEKVLRLVGIGLVLAGYVQWFFPGLVTAGDAVVTGAVLAALFISTGVGLYLFAARGFRRELHFEVPERRLSFGRLNTRDRCLISRQIPLESIETMIVSRPDPEHPLAGLMVRPKGSSRSYCVMRGARSEIEELHRQLCRDIHIAVSVPDQPVYVHPRFSRRLRRRRPGRSFSVGAAASSAGLAK